MSERRRAVFLDRDGTLIEDAHYIARPELVVLRPGAGDAVRRLNQAGVLAIIITNQSGIGRGMISIEQYETVRARMDELLAAEGARIDATYLCPHRPDIGEPCACRKPGLLLFDRAIADHAIDAARSAFIGDRWRDVSPGVALGGRAILVPSPETGADDLACARTEAEVAPSLVDAVARVLG